MGTWRWYPPGNRFLFDAERLSDHYSTVSSEKRLLSFLTIFILCLCSEYISKSWSTHHTLGIQLLYIGLFDEISTDTPRDVPICLVSNQLLRQKKIQLYSLESAIDLESRWISCV